MPIEATAAAAALASEALVAEFEKLVERASVIADMVDEIRATAEEFEQVVRDTLHELDSTGSEFIHQATNQTEAAHGAITSLSNDLATIAHAMRTEGVQLTQSLTEQIGHAIDEQRDLVIESKKQAIDAVATLNEELQVLLVELRDRFDQIDRLQVEAQGAIQTIHSEARTTAQEFAGHLTSAMNDTRTAGGEFAQRIEEGDLVPIEELLAEVEKLVGELAERLFDKGLGSLTETVEKAVRDEVSELIDQAIEAVKQMIKDKIDEILERRDRSEPERKALEAIFDALESMFDTLKDKAGSVKTIQATVGF